MLSVTRSLSTFHFISAEQNDTIQLSRTCETASSNVYLCSTTLTSVKPGPLSQMSLIMASAAGLATLCLRVRCFFRFFLDSKTSLPFFKHSWGNKNIWKMSRYPQDQILNGQGRNDPASFLFCKTPDERLPSLKIS